MIRATGTTPAISRNGGSPPAPSVFPGTRTQTSYVLPDSLEYERWEKAGEILLVIGQAAMWWVGDWYLFGERTYGERAVQAARKRVLTKAERRVVAQKGAAARNKRLTKTERHEAARKAVQARWAKHRKQKGNV